MKLTDDELAIIRSRLPFDEMPEGADRLKAISAFMHAAERLYHIGPERMCGAIEAVDEDDETVRVIFEEGDHTVGIQSGWIVERD